MGASLNSKLIYQHQNGIKLGKADAAEMLREQAHKRRAESRMLVRENAQRKRDEALATIPRDTRAPSVVQKADEDLKQQQIELGEADDDQSNVPTETAAGGEADRGEALSSEPASAEAPAEPKRKSARKKA